MADNERIELLRVKLEWSQQDAQKVRAGLQNHKRDVEDFKRGVETTDRVTKQLNTELERLNRVKSIEKITKDFDRAVAETNDWNKALKDLHQSLTAIGAKDSEIQRVARSIAQAKDATTGGAAASGGGILDRLSDPANRRGSLSRFGALVRSLPSQQIPGLGIGTDAIGNFSRLGGALGVSVTQAAALSGAAAGLVVALKLAQEQFERTKEAAKADLDARNRVMALIQEGTTAEVQARLDELKAKKEVNQAIADDARNILDSLRSGIANDPTIRALLGPQIAHGFTELGAALGIGAGQLAAAKDNADAANKALNENNTEIGLLEQALQANATAANDAARAEKELAEAREKAIPRLEALAKQADDQITRFQEQVLQTQEDRNIRDSREAEDHALRREAQNKAHLARLEAIDIAGLERLENIREQGQRRIAEADKQLDKINASIADVANKFRNDLAKIDRDFYANERADHEKFRKTELKALQEYNIRRARMIEDTNDDLADLEASNDVAAFVRRQRDADKELRRLEEDRARKSLEQQEALAEDRAINEQRRAERIADLQAAAEERRADLLEQLQERQAAKAQLIQDIADTLAAEKQRLADTRKAQQDAFQQQLADEDAARALRLKRQTEDDRRADDRRLAALNKSLADIAAKAKAEAEAIGIVGVQLNNLIAAVASGTTAAIARIVNSAGAMGGGSSYGYNSPNINSSGGFGTSGSTPWWQQSINRLRGFATGGVADRPMIGLLGERPGWKDWVVPGKQNETFQQALNREGGGKQVVINLNGNISGVDENFVEQKLMELGQVIIEADAASLYGRSA